MSSYCGGYRRGLPYGGHGAFAAAGNASCDVAEDNAMHAADPSQTASTAYEDPLDASAIRDAADTGAANMAVSYEQPEDA